MDNFTETAACVSADITIAYGAAVFYCVNAFLFRFYFKYKMIRSVAFDTEFFMCPGIEAPGVVSANAGLAVIYSYHRLIGREQILLMCGKPPFPPGV